MPSGTRDAEWHVNQDQEVKFFRYTPQRNGLRGWLLVHGVPVREYFRLPIRIRPKNGFWSWDNLFGMMSLVFLSFHHDQFLSLKSIANECFSSPCTRSCRLHRVWILVNSLLYKRVSGVPMRRGMRSPLTCLDDERRV